MRRRLQDAGERAGGVPGEVQHRRGDDAQGDHADAHDGRERLDLPPRASRRLGGVGRGRARGDRVGVLGGGGAAQGGAGGGERRDRLAVAGHDRVLHPHRGQQAQVVGQRDHRPDDDHDPRATCSRRRPSPR